MDKPECNVTVTPPQQFPLMHARDADICQSIEYQNGLLCSWMGLNVTDMSRFELVQFIGMLDLTLTDERMAHEAKR